MTASAPDGRRMLLADVGGTNARFAIAEGETITARERRDTTGIASFPATIEDLLTAWGSVDAVALAVAGPVAEGVAPMPNAHLTINAAEVAAVSGTRVRLLNDFEALAWALPHLRPDDLVTLSAGAPNAPNAADRYRGAPLAVMGPGTGLGVCAWIPVGPETPVAGRGLITEGGHVTLAARSDKEAEVLARLRERFGHVSAERVLSGPGIALLHEILTGAALSPDAVAAAAHAGDAAARATMALYFGLLGTVAGDVALTFGARAGLYLGGGILPKLRDMLIASDFLGRFADKGRFGGYLQEIPVHLIVTDDAAFIGLIAAATANHET